MKFWNWLYTLARKQHRKAFNPEEIKIIQDWYYTFYTQEEV